MEAYFFFFYGLRGGDYYVRDNSTNNSTIYPNICICYKIHLMYNNIVFIIALTNMKTCLTVELALAP